MAVTTSYEMVLRARASSAARDLLVALAAQEHELVGDVDRRARHVRDIGHDRVHGDGPDQRHAPAPDERLGPVRERREASRRRSPAAGSRCGSAGSSRTTGHS